MLIPLLCSIVLIGLLSFSSLASATLSSEILADTGFTLNDLMPSSSSPVVDVGATLGSPYNVDFAGTSRPQGSAYDIGAMEYTTGGGGGSASGPYSSGIGPVPRNAGAVW